MVTGLVVNPARYSQFGPAEGSVFCLVTNPEIIDLITVVRDAPYAEYRTVLISAGDDFDQLLTDGTIPEESHTLVISPYRFFESPAPEVLGGRRKLLGMASNSTPTTPEVIEHFLKIMEKSSAREQTEFSERFFELAESTENLVYVDERHGTRAVLDHFAEGLVWNQQAGFLDWGEQQIVPSGEISVLPIEIIEFDENLYLPLEGQVAFRGFPILHSGTPSFSRRDQARLQQGLAGLQEHAIVADVTKGKITSLRPFEPEGKPVAEVFDALISVDSRYALVWEIGHALNTSLDILPGNHAMNEVYGGEHGCLHWGLGLTPFTQYHLDIISPDTTVYTENGEVVLGDKGGAPSVRIAGGF
ncbi:hypothetical protein ACLQ18_40340 [Streptomyces sp. DT193]|uniref:hypothetical protein n=1 Tax=Streptomyces sp. DT193 TaxID=3393418 RepID=UPI003CF136A8